MRDTCRRNIRRMLCYVALVMTVLLIDSTFISFSYGFNNHFSIFSNPALSFTDKHKSLQPTENQFFYTVLSAQLALQEIKPTQKMAGRIQNRQNYLQTHFNMRILSLTGISLLIHQFTLISRKKNKHISVIAFLTGGHSPPSVQAG